MTIRFGVFKLQHKTHKVKEKDDEVVDEYKLVFKDDLGNTLKVKADADDFDRYEPETPLEWKMTVYQSRLDETAEQP